MDQPVRSIDHRVAMNCYVYGCVSLGYHLMVFQIFVDGEYVHLKS